MRAGGSGGGSSWGPVVAVAQCSFLGVCVWYWVRACGGGDVWLLTCVAAAVSGGGKGRFGSVWAEVVAEHCGSILGRLESVHCVAQYVPVTSGLLPPTYSPV